MQLRRLVPLLAALLACSSATPPPDTTEPDPCDCGARLCGTLCGRSCGACPDDGVCAADGLTCREALPVGSACTSDLACGTRRICLSGERVPGGYCSRRCSATNPCPDGAACGTSAGGEQVCLVACAGAETCRTSEGYACEAGACAACVGSCDGRSCGDDGCGHACGTCDVASNVCSAGQCVIGFGYYAQMKAPRATGGEFVEDARWDLAALPNANGKVFLIGGRRTYVDGTLQHHAGVSTVTIFDPGDKSFVAYGALPEAIARPHAVLLGGAVYVAGGIVDSDDPAVADRASTLFVKQDRGLWSRLSAAPMPRPSMGGAALVQDGKLWLLAGLADGSVSAGVDAYDPVADAWSAAPDRTVARAFFGAASDGQRLWVVGGSDGVRALATVEVYEPGQGWTRTQDLPIAVANPSAFVADGRLFVMGSVDGTGLGVSDLKPYVQAIDLATKRTTFLGRTNEDVVASAAVLSRSGTGLLFGGAEMTFATWRGRPDVVSFQPPAR